MIKPFNARLTKPLVPTMRSLHSDGDTVIALFDGEALALDGKPYRNRSGLENQAELLFGCLGRQNDPTASPTNNGRTC